MTGYSSFTSEEIHDLSVDFGEHKFHLGERILQ